MKPKYLFALLAPVAALVILTNLPGDASATSHSSAQATSIVQQPQGGPTATPTMTGCPLQWSIVPSQDLSTTNTLNGVKAITANDVWAVGTGGSNPLLEHWNGVQWALASPTPSIGFSHKLNAVDAVATNDVWAVGWYEGSAMGTLTMHWNGSAWSWVQSPNGTGYYNELTAISARTATDVWAVGYQITSSPTTNHTLTEHWNGSSWSVIPSPDMSGNGYLRGVVSIAANNAWAVGTYNDGAYDQPMMLHWDGATWSVWSTFNFGQGGGSLRAIAAISANDIWVVGNYYSPSGHDTLTIHWNGSVWSIVPSPVLGGGVNHLNAVDALASNDVWAVGTYYFYGGSQTEAMHWDGSAWTLSPSLAPYSFTEFNAVTIAGPDDLWAVGSYKNGSNTYTLTEHYTVQCITPTPTVHTPSPTPVPYTSTPTSTCPSAWNTVPSPDYATPMALTGVKAFADGSAFAVGTANFGSAPPMLDYWNGTQWAIVTATPNIGFAHELNAVDGPAPYDVWAVGWYEGSFSGSLTMHFNGSSWSWIGSPNPIPGTWNYLTAVSARTANDVWAVGGAYVSGNSPQPVIIHWNGSAWVVVTPPTVNGTGYLQGVSAISANDAWAVGTYGTGSSTRPMVLHWDGTAWNVAPSPVITIDSALYGIKAISANDIWAVGYAGSQTLTMHWNGATWSIIASPNVGAGANKLYGVDATASNDVWAVGKYAGSGGDQNLAMHWNGSAWSVVSIPVSATSSSFAAVSMTASNNVWTVGTLSDGTASHEHSLTARYSPTLCTTPSPTPPCPPSWGTVPSVNGSGANANHLNGVEAISTNDVWAVGVVGINLSGFIEHWNGSQWSLVPHQSAGFADKLNSVSAVNANDAWAVGWYEGSTAGTLTEHWNGVTWTYVPSPNGTASTWNELFGVSALAGNNVWAVGTTDGFGGTDAKPVTILWNGTSWSLVTSTSPASDGNGILRGVSAVTPTDVWAVGTYLSGSTTRAMALHWNGIAWSVSPLPAFPADSTLYSVSARASNDVWAVGTYSGQTLILRWTGSWSVYPSPNLGTEPNSLSGIDALALNDAWAVGKYKLSGADHTLTMHWNGTDWTVAPSADPELVNSLAAVSILASNNVWAVGSSDNEVAQQGDTLTEHYSSQPCGTITPTITPTPTSTSMATATPTACSVYYTYSLSEGSVDKIAPGTTPLLSDCHDCAADVRLPFAFTFYGQTYNNVNIQTFGNIQFTTSNSSPHTCPFPFPQMGPAIMPYWSEFEIFWGGSGDGPCVQNYGVRCGIYTTITGSPPNRVYNIQWVGVLYGSNHETVNFQARLHETTGIIDFVYGNGIMSSYQSAIGVQDGAGHYTSFACNSSANLQNTIWTPVYGPCATATGTPPTATPTRTATATNTPVATPTACPQNYSYSISAGGVVTGTTLLAGSQCGSCVVPLTLPFPFTYYGQTYTTANVSTIGNVQFATTDTSSNSCAPYFPQLGPAMMPNWDASIDTSQLIICRSLVGRDCGIYTSVTGSAPNRTFNIEWLGRRSGSNTYIINFELRIYENTREFDFVYGVIRPPPPGHFSTVGIQDGSGSSVAYACNVDNSLYPDLSIRWTPIDCPPTPTPDPTSTGTPTTATATPTPTISPTPAGTTTRTGTPSIVTATPTSTVGPTCALSFSDVPVDNPFYPFIRCLACRNIISGYNDGTFRPGNEITRGQVAKMVSNAAGFAEDPGPQVYEDVDQTNPFYQWINRLSNRGFIGGYPCGTIDPEPCVPPDDRPYFRTFADTTRGQLSKIVANAAGVGGTPIGVFYTDVQEDNPFYLWIMRLTDLGVMSGYPCGSEGEPCDDQQRPYFRPFNNVTRGQSSKIVANTFFPNCQTPNR